MLGENGIPILLIIEMPKNPNIRVNTFQIQNWEGDLPGLILNHLE
jgi:hypothetical protein